MTLSFASAPGNLFNRLGKIAALVKNLHSYQNTQLTAMVDTSSGVVAQLNSESDVQAIMGGNYISIESATSSAIGGVVQTLAAAVVNRMVFRDSPRLGQTLTNANTVASLLEVIRQMKSAGATVLAQTVTATPTLGFTGVGTDGVINSSVRRPSDGLVLENAFAESLLFTCTADSYTGGARSGNEVFAVTGTGPQSDVFAFNWPLGSNCSVSVLAVDGDTSNGSGNLLTNSGFLTWVAGAPSNFAIVTGGSLITQETGLAFTNGSALHLTGDGSTLVSFEQQFGSSTGTTGTLSALSQYSVNIFLRRGGTGISSGTLTVDLVDSLGTVIQDRNSVNNSFAIDLTGLSTSYASYTGVFRTPEALPSTYFLRLRLTQAQTAGTSVYMGKMSLGLMSQVAINCPFVAVHSGSIPFQLSDYGSLVVTNSRGPGGTLDTWQTVCFRILPTLASNELLLPSSNSPTISDGLIA